MYQSFFGMSHHPFTDGYQQECYFPGSSIEEAVAAIQYCVARERGIGLLTGDPGTGKTVACRRLASVLRPEFACGFIANTSMTSRKGLLQTILHSLNVPFHGLDEQELRLAFSDYLIGRYSEGGRTLIIVDEAQSLSTELLEEFRQLGNLQGELSKLLHLVLVGQPNLAEKILAPELAGLAQRIGTRATLEPLDEEETLYYIGHQLQQAGAAPARVFTHEAAQTVYEATMGVPRLINKLCDHALLLAYVSEAQMVDSELVEQAEQDLCTRLDSEYDHEIEEGFEDDIDELSIQGGFETTAFSAEETSPPDERDDQEFPDEVEYPTVTQDSDETPKLNVTTRTLAEELQAETAREAQSSNATARELDVASLYGSETIGISDHMEMSEHVIIDACADLDSKRLRDNLPERVRVLEDTTSNLHESGVTLDLRPKSDEGDAQQRNRELAIPQQKYLCEADEPEVFEIGAAAESSSNTSQLAQETTKLSPNSAETHKLSRVDPGESAPRRPAGSYRRLFSFTRKN